MIRISYRGKFPNISYQTDLSAGADLYSEIGLEIPIGGRAVIPTGVYIADYDTVFISGGLGIGAGLPLFPYLQVCSRSGLAAKNGIFVLNSPGIIDCTYPDEIKVILVNSGEKPFLIEPGDRIAQLVAGYTFNVKGVDIKDVKRVGGLGSTGK